MLSHSREVGEVPSGIAEQRLLSAFRPSHHFWLEKGKISRTSPAVDMGAGEHHPVLWDTQLAPQGCISILTAHVVPGTAPTRTPAARETCGRHWRTKSILCVCRRPHQSGTQHRRWYVLPPAPYQSLATHPAQPSSDCTVNRMKLSPGGPPLISVA